MANTKLSDKEFEKRVERGTVVGIVTYYKFMLQVALLIGAFLVIGFIIYMIFGVKSGNENSVERTNPQRFNLITPSPLSPK